MRTIVPSGSMCTITMTGKEIMEKATTGKLIQFNDAEEDIAFPYILVTNHNMELEEEVLYQLVIAQHDLSKEQQDDVLKLWTPVESQNMMKEYFSSLKDVISKEVFYQW